MAHAHPQRVGVSRTLVAGGVGLGVAGANVTITDHLAAVAGTAAIPGWVSVSGLAGSAMIQVGRTGGSTGAVSLDWTAVGSSAVDGVNFTAGSGTLHWAAGDSADKAIVIPVFDDGAVGPNRYFRVSLANAGGGAAILIDPDLGMPEAIVCITDAQCQAGSIAWVSAAVQVHESAGSVTLSARRSGGSAGPVSVSLTSLELTARLGVDYTPGDVANLVWADGDVADKSITIPILHDGSSGTDRAFRVLLGPASGGATVAPPTALVVTIQEDDQVLAAPVASGGGASSASASSDTSSAGGGGCSGGAVAMLLGLACAMTGPRRRVQ